VGALFGFDTNGSDRTLMLVASLALSFGLSYVVASFIVRAVESLIADAHALAAGVSGHRSVIRSSDEIGQLALALNQMADTVERRNAALADNERRYRFLFDSNPLPMWAWDAETTNILAVNEAAIEKYGYPRDTFLTLRIVDLLDESELPRFSGARLPFSESRQSAGTCARRLGGARTLLVGELRIEDGLLGGGAACVRLGSELVRLLDEVEDRVLLGLALAWLHP
jgi:PAS domain-containing protein